MRPWPRLLLLLMAMAAGCGRQRDVIATDGALPSGTCQIATLGYGGVFGTDGAFTGWLATAAAPGATSLEASLLTAARLARYQIVVVLDVRSGSPGRAGRGRGIGRAYSADEAEALRRWVAQGGGLLTLTAFGNQPSENDNVNGLLAPHGLRYGATPLLPSGGRSSRAVTQWADHPLALGVVSVGANTGYPVQGGGTPIASAGQDDLGRAVDSGSGRVFAWGDEWITYDSDWTQRADYQVAQFWANALSWLSRGQCRLPMPGIQDALETAAERRGCGEQVAGRGHAPEPSDPRCRPSTVKIGGPAVMDHHLFHGSSASYWIRYEKEASGEVLATAAGPTAGGWLGTVATARGPTREQAERMLLEKLRCLDS